MVPFIDTQQIDSTSKYHSFEFVSINYKLEGGVFLEPKLSNGRINDRLVSHEMAIRTRSKFG